jgi:hypothetical protein
MIKSATCVGNTFVHAVMPQSGVGWPEALEEHVSTWCAIVKTCQWSSGAMQNQACYRGPLLTQHRVHCRGMLHGVVGLASKLVTNYAWVSL